MKISEDENNVTVGKKEFVFVEKGLCRDCDLQTKDHRCKYNIPCDDLVFTPRKDGLYGNFKLKES
ncbi:MAG: hypothetical protein WCL70_07880 [Paludibacter sp.]